MNKIVKELNDKVKARIKEEIQWNKANWMRELARQYRAGEIG